VNASGGREGGPLQSLTPPKRFVVAASAATKSVTSVFPALGASAERGAKIVERAFARNCGSRHFLTRSEGGVTASALKLPKPR